MNKATNQIKPLVIGMLGGSGSGKTFFLKSFLNHFKASEICLVSQDDYYIPVGHLNKEENKLYNFDLPSTIDYEHFLSDVQLLIAGKSIEKKEYTFNNPNLAPKILTIKAAPIVIVEGLFILHFSEIAALLDKTIFVEANANIALERRIKRDAEERGYNEDDVLYKWHEHVVPAYNTYLLPYKSTCDYVVDNSVNCSNTLLEISAKISKDIKAILNIHS